MRLTVGLLPRAHGAEYARELILIFFYTQLTHPRADRNMRAFSLSVCLNIRV